MSFRQSLNRILGPLSGYEIAKVEFGRDLWSDVETVLGGNNLATVFDVGANEGQSARQFLRRFPRTRVFSFDPTPSTFHRLARLADGQPRLRAVNLALGEEPGRVAFNENAFHQTNSILPATADGAAYVGPAVIERQRQIEVEMTTLDAFCRRESVEAIDLLKIDVQGFEAFVLKGAREMLAERRIGCIVLEVNFVPLYERQASVHELIDLLGEQLYDPVGFYDFFHSPQRKLMWCEMVFTPRG